ncbi:hypothetical protein EON67_12330 [archaeon]|nr:MAG: hypothetical protein EON67_12330 [archaeon]
MVQVPGGSASSATFVISDEDHTLGNSLRYTLMRTYVGTHSRARVRALHPCSGRSRAEAVVFVLAG